jgi:uncharacterized membrane protein YidH (DUF202 family)
MQERLAAEEAAGRRSNLAGQSKSGDTRGDDDTGGKSSNQGGYGTMSSVFPSFSLSRYAQARRERDVQLPPGVTKPTQLIKDSGPLQVEPKVWLANERTFLKWGHICVLMGTLSVALANAAYKSNNTIAKAFSFIYLAVAVFAGGWGIYMHRVRRTMIKERSGKDFDNWIGPAIISIALISLLIVNFVLKVSSRSLKVLRVKWD